MKNCLLTSRTFTSVIAVAVATCLFGTLAFVPEGALAADPWTASIEAVAPQSSEPTTAEAATSAQGTETVFWVAVLTTILSILSISIAVAAVWWRKSLEGGLTHILPEKLLLDWNSVSRTVKQQSQSLGQLANGLDAAEARNTEKMVALVKTIEELFQATSLFQRQLDEKDREVSRLRNGADAVVIQKFLDRFFRLHRNMTKDLEQYREDSEVAGILQDQLDELEDALLDCGVVKFSPELGTPIDQAQGVSPGSKKVSTEDPQMHLKIAEVLRPGFLMETAEQPRILKTAEVSVFVTA